MAGVQKCSWKREEAGVAQPFALQLAAKWFGMSEADVEAAAGRFTRGKNKGKLRGWIVWQKCTEGGWCYPLHSVIKPGMMFAHFVKTWDEMANLMGLATDRFMAGAVRVDTSYGYSPEAERARIAEQALIAAERAAEREADPKGDWLFFIEEHAQDTGAWNTIAFKYGRRCDAEDDMNDFKVARASRVLRVRRATDDELRQHVQEQHRQIIH
jgi:hypothetical protein